MKNVKKIAALGLSATMAMGMLPATLVSADEATGTVYYLNFKPEQADQWKDLAEKYTEETGVQVDVVTAASGTYESTLKSEMAIRGSDIVPGKWTSWSGYMEGLLL